MSAGDTPLAIEARGLGKEYVIGAAAGGEPEGELWKIVEDGDEGLVDASSHPRVMPHWRGGRSR